MRVRVTPVAATKKMKTPYQNLRHEQHDVRREPSVVLVVDDQRPGHPARLERRAPVAVGVVPERARRVCLGQVVHIRFARAGRYECKNVVLPRRHVPAVHVQGRRIGSMQAGHERVARGLGAELVL